MLHIQFREVASRVEDIGKLAKIAEALKAGEVGAVMVYFEFADSDQLALFCRTINIMEVVKEIETLQKEKAKLQSNVDALTEEVQKLEKRKEKRK